MQERLRSALAAPNIVKRRSRAPRSLWPRKVLRDRSLETVVAGTVAMVVKLVVMVAVAVAVATATPTACPAWKWQLRCSCQRWVKATPRAVGPRQQYAGQAQKKKQAIPASVFQRVQRQERL